MELWEKLLSSALLGTERSQPQLPADSPELLRRLERTDAEHQLLVSAAVAALYRRAGYLPVTNTAQSLPPAPGETQPGCSSRSTFYLDRLLQTPYLYYLALLGEWLEHIASKGKRVPYPYLPSLFDLASQHKKNKRLAVLVARVMGERGRWLAAQHAKWGFLLSVELPIQIVDAPAPVTTEETQAIKALQAKKLTVDGLHSLLQTKANWSPQLLAALVQYLLRERDKEVVKYITQTLIIVAHDLPPVLLDDLIEYLKAEDTGRRNEMNSLIGLLEFRRDMLEELANE